MRFDDAFLTELRSRADIESIISSYVNIKRAGRISKGLCPFHGEKTASFTVYPDTQSYYCFGCGNGGDVITFIKNIENLDYLDAIKFLADRVGAAAGKTQQHGCVTCQVLDNVLHPVKVLVIRLVTGVNFLIGMAHGVDCDGVTFLVGAGDIRKILRFVGNEEGRLHIVFLQNV